MDKMVEFGLRNRLWVLNSRQHRCWQSNEKALWLTHAIMAKNSREQLVSCQNDLKEEMWNVSAWCFNRELFGQNWIARGGTGKVVTHPSLALRRWDAVLSHGPPSHACNPIYILSPFPAPNVTRTQIYNCVSKEITVNKRHMLSTDRYFIKTKSKETLDRLTIMTFLGKEIFFNSCGWVLMWL